MDAPLGDAARDPLAPSARLIRRLWPPVQVPSLLDMTGVSVPRQWIVRIAQSDLGLWEDPPRSNRAPWLDALCLRWGIPTGSAWCALLAADVWRRAGVAVPPITGTSHPARAESWHQWAESTGRLTETPTIGDAVLYGVAGVAHHIGACVVAVRPNAVLNIEGNAFLSGLSRGVTDGECTALREVDQALCLGYVSVEPLASRGGTA